MQDATMPHSRESEEAVIGSVLIDPSLYDDLAEYLRPSDFYIHRLGWVWSAFAGLRDQGADIDFITTASELERRGQLEEAGGPAFLTALLTRVPTSLHADSYARKVLELSGKRQMLAMANKIAEYSMNGKGVGEIVTFAELELGKVSTGNGLKLDTGQTSAELAGKIYDQVGDGKPETDVISTGLIDLDRVLRGGMRPGRLYIFAGGAGEGKSTLLLNLGVHAAEAGKRVWINCGEMPNSEQTERMLAMLSGVDYGRIESHRLIDDDWPAFTKAVETSYTFGLTFDDTAALTIPELRGKLRKVIGRDGLDMVVVDSLNLMNAQQPAAKQYERINWLGYQLKIIAREFNVPVLVAHHLHRPENGSDREPVLTDLEQAGEKPADVVAFVYKRKDEDGNSVRHVKIAKQRNGPTGTIDMIYRGSIFRFENATTRKVDLNLAYAERKDLA